ncbi:MAG: SufD family Fe-S cluster assembly protein [Jannaschia sp.]
MLPAATKTVTDERVAALRLPESTGWLGDARAQALARVEAVGLPSRRDEYWRYTNPAALVQAAPAVDEAHGAADPFDGIDAVMITFDGDSVSIPSDLPDGLEIAALSGVEKTDIHWARDLYGVLEAQGSKPVLRPLASLNTAYATEGVLIRVTGHVDRPVHVRTVGDGDPMLHHVVKVEAQASVTLLKSGTAGARSNVVTEVDVADGGACRLVTVQGPDHDRHTNTHMFARLGTESVFHSFTLSANGRLTRNEAVVELTGDDAVCQLAGAAFGGTDFHHDDTVFITHDAVNCESRQVFKKVLRAGATGVFQGKILVKEGAQKTDGYQISQSLLLDDESVFLAKPELEIYADDVACSHGSTTGAIDETALFYLRSRGVSKREATDLLVLSFLAEPLEEIDDEALREHVSGLLAAWLARH